MNIIRMQNPAILECIVANIGGSLTLLACCALNSPHVRPSSYSPPCSKYTLPTVCSSSSSALRRPTPTYVAHTHTHGHYAPARLQVLKCEATVTDNGLSSAGMPSDQSWLARSSFETQSQSADDSSDTFQRLRSCRSERFL